ncbi:tetratricopeptide repeat protein, partial [Leptospira alexanderi]|uniref:tetratricopeptide repeat protein n=1 Tax=Leptospira alexanderi TaxID=100053 RepID=UPI000990DFBE
MKSILHYFIYSILIIFFLLPQTVFSEEVISGSHESGKKFIEEKRFLEAEKLAVSLLTNNPSDVNAEYILTSAWVGLGREEAKKGNLEKAVELLQKARQKWPFDQELKKEIELLGNISSRKNVSANSFQNRKSSNSQSIILIDTDLLNSIQNLKSELNLTLTNLKETSSYKKELESFSKKEKLYFSFISILTLVSFCNLALT